MRGPSRISVAVVLGFAPALLAASSASAAISLSGDMTVPEGNASLSTATLTLSDDLGADSLSRGWRCVELRTVDGSATAGSDYQAFPNLTAPNTIGLCLEPEVRSKTFSVVIWGDTTVEPNESFSVEVASAHHGSEPYPVADGRAVITLSNDDVQSPPPTGNDPPPPADYDPKDCTIAAMQEHYGDRDGPWPEGEGQFFGLMRIAAKNLGPGGITELLAGRGKFANVLTCPTGTLVGRVHKMRREKPPLLLAAGRLKLDYHGPGRTSVRLKLTKRGRSLLEGRSRLKVRATVRHVDLQGTAAQRRVKVTLTR